MLEIRPTEPRDCEAFFGRAPPYRIRAYTGLLDGTVIAIGGIGFPPNGRVMAFCNATDMARKHPVSLHRFARKVLEEAKASGVRRLIATMDEEQPAAGRWLKRLGFTPETVVDGKTVWTWQP